MFLASLFPSSGEQDRVLLYTVFCNGCAGCGCVELGRKLCALCEGYCSALVVLVVVVWSWVVSCVHCMKFTTQLYTTTTSTTSAEHHMQ